jgi:hypothetical protein
MPQKQTIMWTALPNGLTSGGDRLKLSVFVSPRLETTEGLPRPQLLQFPDFLSWTAKVQGVQFAVQFEGGAAVQATRVGPALEPDLWAALFKPSTYVEPYVPVDYSSHLILSHPVANVSAFIKTQYQDVAATSPTAHPARSVLMKQLAPISLYEAPPATQAETLTQRVVTPPAASQTGAKPAQKTVAAQPAARQLVIPPTLQTFVHNLQPQTQASATRKLNTLLRQPLPMRPEAMEAFQSVFQDLQQYKAVRPSATLRPSRDFLQVRISRPTLEAELTPLQPPDIDFHKLVSTLGNYPELMRRLGLVIDLEVPVPSGVSSSTVKVVPSWAQDSPPSAFNTDFSPKTACMLDVAKSRFFARPETPDSKIVNGLLNLSDEKSYPVVHVDVVGSALKMANLADRLVSSPALQTHAASVVMHPMLLQTGTEGSKPESAGAQAATTQGAAVPAEPVASLPALRTTGFSVAHAGRAESLVNVFAKAALKNKAVEANTPDQVTHYADDLVRGYRVDVWDSQSNAWHPLCQRKGTYNFFEANLTRQYDDEGFVQLGVTQSAAPASAGEPPKDLYLQESMFTWDGWSLSAPRPGKTIAPDGTPQRLDDAATAQQRATSDFKMVVTFVPQSGSLPRLRFGNTYRIRARVVDLAGNSLAHDAPDPADFSKATASHPYTRFEPVMAPLAVLTRTVNGTNSPGESLYRPVIRSNYDKSASDYAPPYASLVSDPEYTAFALRLIAPPKTSQLMAERHSMFDSPSGAMKKNQATYDMISHEAEGAFMLDPVTRLPIQKKLEIPYLPDPLCRGASFALLDSANHLAATVPGVSFYPSGSDWPDALPFLLKVSEGMGKTSWQWDDANRTLTVQLAKAEVVTFDVSSLLGDGDLGTRNQQALGIWHWMQEAAPTNLPQLRQNVVEGRLWMVTPARQIVLVHAVQQPLIAPQFHLLTPNRHLGETFAYIVDDQSMPIDGKSTVKVDFEAAWQEPLDDPSDPNGPKTLNGSAHVAEWKITPEQTAIEIKTAVALPQGSPPSTATTPAAAKTKTQVVAAPLAQQKTVTPEAKPATAVTMAPLIALKPGALIPKDVRAVRPIEMFPATQKFGYSWRHDFGDTKYRKVSYAAVATTRFADYFPIKDPALLTRTSPTVDVDVPNSARPPLPQVLYAIPTFEWQKQTEVKVDKEGLKLGPLTLPTVKGIGTVSQRLGGGLRVYLDRPWYGSGDGELLGVVVWPSPAQAQTGAAALRPEAQIAKPHLEATQSGRGKETMTAQAKTVVGIANLTFEVPDLLKHLITQWGMDPIWQTNPLPQDLPRLESFKNAAKTGTGLTLEELADKPEPSPNYYRVAVVGYKPEYDKDRGLWFCDIAIDFGASYFPFIRMALVRYQPISVENAHLSNVVLADFAQLAPDRAATLVYDPKNPKRLDVAVTGLTYAASKAGKGPAEMEVTVEAKPVGADADLGWVPVPEATVALKPEPSGTVTIWRSQVRLDRYKVPKLQELRLVIREYETFVADARGPQPAGMTVVALPSTQAVRRLVYADVLKVPPIL